MAKKPLNDFESTMLCFAYRYAIGRHSIASVHFAGEIVENYYSRLTDDEMKHIADDMFQCINDCLWGRFNWHYSNMIHYDNRNNLLFLVMSYLIQNKLFDKLAYIDKVTVTTEYYNSKDYIFDISYKDNPSTSAGDMDINDLIVWYNAAALLDKSLHKTAKCKDDDGTIKEVEYFDSIKESYGNGYSIIKVPVDGYIKNPYVSIYIDENRLIK